MALLRAPSPSATGQFVTVKMDPLARRVLHFLHQQGPRGVSQADAFRSLGLAGGSFTKRVSDLRRAGYNITRTAHNDPLTGRVYGRYVVSVPAVSYA